MATRPAFSILICPDSFLWESEVECMLSLFPPSTGTWEKKVFWGDDTPPQTFWDSFSDTGLLGTSSYLLVHNAQAWGQKHWANIDKMIFRLSPYCWPIFCLEGNWERGVPKMPPHIAKSKCLSIAKKKGWVWQQEGINEKNIRSFIEERAKNKGNLPKKILDELALTSVYDARSIENELIKLSLFYSEQKNLNAAEWQIVRDKECNYYACIKYIKQGNLKGVYATLREDPDTSKVFFVIMKLLDREFRLLWEAKTGQSNLTGYQRNYKLQESKTVSLQTLATGMRLLIEADWSIKCGNASTNQAFDTLLIALTRLFAQKNNMYRRF